MSEKIRIFAPENIYSDIMEENNLIISTPHQPALPDTDLLRLADSIAHIVDAAKKHIAVTVNSAMVETYWHIGRHIVEFEQQGAARAKYGKALLRELSKVLRTKIGKGFGHSNLYCMRRFYLFYPKFQTLSGKLSWSHICELVAIDDELERSFYEKECINEHWSLRALRRQIDSGLFMRLALSKDKEGVLSLAHEGIKASDLQRPEDVVRDTYTLEFLGLDAKKRFKEGDLQKLLQDSMKTMLLELGKGFLFQEEQYHICINNRHYHVDLLFYHRILRTYILIDLKRGAVTHRDIGQMNLYLGYFAKEVMLEGENPPIGIVLGHSKDDLMVEYATYGMDTNLFVSKYELYLPNKDDLRRMVSNVLS